ncbi:hypothetical protein GIB67_040053 [Kingdonia uniflora]|uniref:Uncharacterized protein n=1 Tax=Kingdonia uniflora TaxID=39325 RepID=A0A7J7MUD8_9MAGN|nr:hypothetical protein GIB67_040053 [Kingdonia uniflora]
MTEERDKHDTRTRYTKNHYEGKRKGVPVRRDDVDMCPEEPSFQKLRDNIKAFLPSSIKPQSVVDRGRSISRERKSSNFERSPSVLCDLTKKDKVLSSEVRAVTGVDDCCSSSTEVEEEGFLCYLNQVTYGLSIPLTFFQKWVMNALKSCSRQLNGNIFEMMRVCEVLNQKWRDGGIARQFVTNDVLKYYKFKCVKDQKSGYLFSDSAKLKFFDFESSGRPWCDHLVMFVAVLVESNPKAVADTSSLFDVVSREEIPACTMGTSSSLVRRPRIKKTVPPSEQTAHVQIPPVGTEGVVTDVNMASPLKKQKKESGKDIRASSKGVNLEVVEQEALDLVTCDPIRLDTQIRSNISQSATEVLKLAAANRGELVWQHDAENVVLQEQFEMEKVLQREQFKKEKVLQREQFKKEAASAKQKIEDEAKKAVDIAVASRNKLIQAFYVWGLSREDVDLALAGKYGEIIFLEDDASPAAEQTPAPPVADDPTKEEVVHLRGKVIEMEKALSRARDSINRTQQGQKAMRIIFFNIEKEDRKIHAQLEIDLRHACDELERCKGRNAYLKRDKMECAKLL